jgi:GT2 family glycosyltransferase
LAWRRDNQAMLSVVIPVRNARHFAGNCLACAAGAFASAGKPEDFEFILIDDYSDAEAGISELFEEFRRSTASKTTLVYFKSRQYYTYACSLGFSMARGDAILLLSHDMVLTPTYVRMLMQAAARDQAYGIVRGCSQSVDLLPEHVIVPPLPTRNYEDICNFSQYVARYHGSDVVEDRLLIGDSFLVKRDVIDKIGVMDTAYRHLFGDIDFGLRAQRAGFKLVCAKGAWLHHEGRGYAKNARNEGADAQSLEGEIQGLFAENYGLFRSRWDSSMPEIYGGNVTVDFEKLRKQEKRFEEYAPLIKVDEAICRVVE